MHVAIVTEIDPPDVNGVALTVSCLEIGRCACGPAVSLGRPRKTESPQATAPSRRTFRVGWRRTVARRDRARASGLHLLRPPARRSVGPALRQRRPVPVASESETFGSVTLEAMASGVAPVAFNDGAAREHLRDGVHGKPIGESDNAAFAAAACRIPDDGNLRQKLGSAARRAVIGLRPAQVYADFESIFNSLATRSTRHAPPAAA